MNNAFFKPFWKLWVQLTTSKGRICQAQPWCTNSWCSLQVCQPSHMTLMSFCSNAEGSCTCYEVSLLCLEITDNSPGSAVCSPENGLFCLSWAFGQQKAEYKGIFYTDIPWLTSSWVLKGSIVIGAEVACFYEKSQSYPQNGQKGWGSFLSWLSCQLSGLLRMR